MALWGSLREAWLSGALWGSVALWRHGSVGFSEGGMALWGMKYRRGFVLCPVELGLDHPAVCVIRSCASSVLAICRVSA
jgi:hypothetical protein